MAQTAPPSSSNRVLQDKPSYGTIPTTPSPTHSTPSLTQSGSNSSSSPPQPTTPPPRKNSSRTRYSDLSRVPLHRRGTSSTYENLEDLLREAGYKETRVFTPESERVEKLAADAKRNSVADTVVGFLTGLIPGSQTGPARQPSPSSPLTHRSATHRQRDQSFIPGGPAPKAQSRHHTAPVPPSAFDSRVSRKAPRRLTTPSSSQQQLQLPFNNSRTSLGRSGSSSNVTSALPSPQPTQNIFHPTPSRASAYLRHMSSIPQIPRPSSTPAQQPTNEYDSLETYSRRNAEGGEEDPLPPLPQTWLESVARAVMFGGAGAYVGGPSGPISSSSAHMSSNQNLAPVTPALRQTRSIIAQAHQLEHGSNHSSEDQAKGLYRSRSGLSDRTNRSRESGPSTRTVTPGSNSQTLAPPELVSRVGRVRSARSVGGVSRTRVVVRSAPASRSGSLSRASGTSAERDSTIGLPGLTRRSSGKEKDRGFFERGRKGKRRDPSNEGVPTLARTKAEGDDLWPKHVQGHRKNRERKEAGDIENRYLSGWGAQTDSGDDAGTSDYLSSEEGESELDLARMLVPAKRQNSIRSLRRHLTGDGQPTASSSLLAASRNNGARYGSGNSKTFRQWMGGRKGTSTEQHWEDGFEQDGRGGGGGWGSGWQARKDPRQRQSLDDDEGSFVGFLEPQGNGTDTGRSTASRNRSGLPAPWSGS